MLGAIIGDMSGSRFEWDNIKTKNFELLNEECFPTDDSIMTLAITGSMAEAYYGIPSAIRERALALLDDNLLIIAEIFEKKFGQKKEI
jgi:type I restriction enzyme M protein